MDNPSLNQNGIEYNGEQIAYKDSTYELVSKVAYLIGVPLRIFQNEHEPPKIEIYNLSLIHIYIDGPSRKLRKV